jgi:hypothetical protein
VSQRGTPSAPRELRRAEGEALADVERREGLFQSAEAEERHLAALRRRTLTICSP